MAAFLDLYKEYMVYMIEPTELLPAKVKNASGRIGIFPSFLLFFFGGGGVMTSFIFS